VPFGKPLAFFDGSETSISREESSERHFVSPVTAALPVWWSKMSQKRRCWVLEVLPHVLEDFNESRWPRHPPWRPLAVCIRDAGTIVAGLSWETYCGRPFIKYL